MTEIEERILNNQILLMAAIQAQFILHYETNWSQETVVKLSNGLGQAVQETSDLVNRGKKVIKFPEQLEDK